MFEDRESISRSQRKVRVNPTQDKRRHFGVSHVRYLSLFILVLLGATLFAWIQLHQAEESYAHIQRQVSESSKLARRIESLSRSMPSESTAKQSADDTMKQIRQNLKLSTIPETQIADMKSLPPSKIARSSFVRTDTKVDLKAVKIVDVLSFMAAQESSSPSSYCTKCEVASPQALSEQTLWDVKLTFSHFFRDTSTKSTKAN